jgi:hypothetical protein
MEIVWKMSESRANQERMTKVRPEALAKKLSPTVTIITKCGKSRNQECNAKFMPEALEKCVPTENISNCKKNGISKTWFDYGGYHQRREAEVTTDALEPTLNN